MKVQTAICFALAWALVAGCDGQRSIDTTLTTASGGEQRTTLVHHPGGANLPLVIVMHGYGGNASDMKYWTKMDSLADLHGYAVCYPEGTTDARGLQHWNANFDWTSTDDVTFIADLVAQMESEFRIDTDNVFACGFSNGGFMSYALACAQPELVRAIGSVAGTMSAADAADCPMDETAVPVIQFCGLADQTIPYSGAIAFPQFGGAPAMTEVMAGWAARHGLSSLPTEPITGFDPAWGDVQRHSYGEQGRPAPVEWITYARGPHTWFEGASEQLFAFFEAHRTP